MTPNTRTIFKKNDDLQTPQFLIDALGPFDLDPCAGLNTTIGKQNYCIDRDEDGLTLPWTGFVYCNPPFSQKEIWIEKMIAHNNGILILPERGSAPWFGPLAQSVGYYFVMGKKIDFVNGPSSNNLGSCLFPFGPIAKNRIYYSGLPGHMNKVQFFTARK